MRNYSYPQGSFKQGDETIYVNFHKDLEAFELLTHIIKVSGKMSKESVKEIVDDAYTIAPTLFRREPPQ